MKYIGLKHERKNKQNSDNWVFIFRLRPSVLCYITCLFLLLEALIELHFQHETLPRFIENVLRLTLSYPNETSKECIQFLNKYDCRKRSDGIQNIKTYLIQFIRVSRINFIRYAQFQKDRKAKFINRLRIIVIIVINCHR